MGCPIDMVIMTYLSNSIYLSNTVQPLGRFTPNTEAPSGVFLAATRRLSLSFFLPSFFKPFLLFFLYSSIQQIPDMFWSGDPILKLNYIYL